MEKNINVILGGHHQRFISRLIAEGRYGSASEAIQAGLRLLEERETKRSSLRRALIEGEDSGTADYTLDGLINEIDADEMRLLEP